MLCCSSLLALFYFYLLQWISAARLISSDSPIMSASTRLPASAPYLHTGFASLMCGHNTLGTKTPRSVQCPGTATAYSSPERGQRPAAPHRPLPAPPATPSGGGAWWGGGRGLAQAPPPWRVPPRAARSPEPVTEGAANTAGCSELAPRRKRGHSTTLQPGCGTGARCADETVSIHSSFKARMLPACLIGN